MPPNNYQHKDKETHSSRHCFNVSGDQGIGQNSSHLVDFVTDANEHERCQDNAEQLADQESKPKRLWCNARAKCHTAL